MALCDGIWCVGVSGLLETEKRFHHVSQPTHASCNIDLSTSTIQLDHSTCWGSG